MSIYDQPFDHKKAQNAKAANDAVDRLRQGRTAAQQARFSQQQASQQMTRPSLGSRVASTGGRAAAATRDFLTRPRSVWGGTKAAAKVAGKALSGVATRAPAVAVGYQVGDGLKDTETAQRLQRPLADALARYTGTDDLQERMLSNDPELSRKAVEEWRAQQPREAERPQPGATPAAASPQSAGRLPRPGSPEAAVDVFTTRKAEPASSEVNASAPAEIPGGEFQYAGQYGGNQVLTRPRNGGDGRPVPEYTDDYTAFQRPRPAVNEQALAQEEARVQAARDQYAANTTGSDGRRYFGGPATEKLREAQSAAVARGDGDIVMEQLADEGRTPEQRAAYDADPAAAYQVDAQAASDAARSRLDTFKSQFDMTRNARADSRAESAEGRKARTAALAEAETLLEPVKNYSPEAYTQMLSLAGEVYDPAAGETMSDVVRRLLASVETENGMPVLDDAGQLKFLEPQQIVAHVSPEIEQQL